MLASDSPAGLVLFFSFTYPTKSPKISVSANDNFSQSLPVAGTDLAAQLFSPAVAAAALYF